MQKIRVATRGSKLALAQTGMAVDALAKAGPQFTVEAQQIVSTGDLKQGTPRARQSDKRDWIHELELAVINGDAEIAVHSGKDIPCDIASETILVPILKRSDPFDVFIGKIDPSLDRRIKFSEVPKNGVIGTASLRRQAQLRMHRPDLKVVEHRGNVPTRLEKLDASDTLSGIILAHAGILRLGIQNVAVEKFPTDIMLPAINQGILVAQVRSDNRDVVNLLKSISDPETTFAFEAERACAQILQGDCNSAICMFADLFQGKLRMRAHVLLPDGSKQISAEKTTSPESARELGEEIAKELLAKGAKELLAASGKFV